MRVDDIGDHICCFVPGGRSLVTAGMPGVTNTSQFSGMSRVLTSVITLFPFLGPPAGVDPHGDVGHTFRVALQPIQCASQRDAHVEALDFTPAFETRRALITRGREVLSCLLS